MALRDHYRPPVVSKVPWESFHAGWPMVLVQRLGKILPERYLALPRAHSGGQIEVDVATYDDGPPGGAAPSETEGGVATAVWAYVKPTLAIETELADPDEYEVRIYDRLRGRRLVAAVEIISPANKDRPEHRRLFAAKCAALLQQRVCVAVVDLVTVRHFNLYADLLELIGEKDPALGDDAPALYAASCRWRPTDKGPLLESWYYPLTVGQALPTLPLWLTDDFAVPLELEASYEQTCRDLRIP